MDLNGLYHKLPPLTGLVVNHTGPYHNLLPLTRVVVAHAGPYHKLSSPNIVTFVKMTTKFVIADTNFVTI